MSEAPESRDKYSTVFVVQHEYERDGCAEGEFIGVSSSFEAAEAAVKRLRSQPGFRDHPQDFHIDHYPLDRDHWAEGFITD